MKYRVKHDGITKTYVWLYHTARHLLERTSQGREGYLLDLQAASVFCAFTFEAYLNHIGDREIPFWNEIDRISHFKKLRVISKHLSCDIDCGRSPFQLIRELFALRNALAHGRTEEIEVSYETDSEPDHMSAWRIHEWEKLTQEKVQLYLSSVKDAIETLNRARSSPDQLVWNQGVRGSVTETIDLDP